MDTRLTRRQALAGMGAAAFGIGSPSILKAQAPITLNGAVQFNDDHAFTKALVRFEERVKALYGKPIAFNLHKNSSLGLEKQYFEYMAQGRGSITASSRRRTCRPSRGRPPSSTRPSCSATWTTWARSSPPRC